LGFKNSGLKIFDLQIKSISDLVFVIHGTSRKSLINSLIHLFVSTPHKTRGAISFAAVVGVQEDHLRHFKIKKAGY
jgi:hypothetical protein